MKTTREEANEKRHEEITKTLQRLLEKNYDAEEGFKKAMREADSPSLKEFCKRRAAQRNHFATAITHELRELNEEPKDSGSTTGKLHRAWIDIKTAFTGNDDEAILEECIRGEKASVEEYEEAVKNHTLPLHVNNILQDQLREVRGTLSRVKTLEDIEDARD